MAEIRCPMCGEPASDELEICPVCQARLKPLIVSSPGDGEFIHPGEGSVRKDTSELEKADLSESSQKADESIQLDETPGRKKSSEFESSQPTWLRKLRGETIHKEPDPEPEFENMSEKSELEEPEHTPDGPRDIRETLEIPAPHETPAEELPGDDGVEELPDWLSGLEQTASQDEDSPAWLSNIKDMPQKERSTADQIDDNVPQVEGNWLDGLRGESPDQELESEQEGTPLEEPVFDEGIPDWMKKLQAEVDSRASGFEPGKEAALEGGAADSPDWLNRLQAETQSTAVANENLISGKADETSDWLEKMSDEIHPTSEEIAPLDSETPQWLKNLQAETQAFAEDSKPDEIEFQAVIEENQSLDTETSEWLKERQPYPGISTGEDDLGSEIPDLLKETAGEVPESIEESPLPLSEETEWLKDIQAETLSSSEESEISQTEMPEWLKEIAAGTLDTPARENPLPGEETPDWLNTLDSELQDPTIPGSMADESSEFSELRSNRSISGTDEMGELIPAEVEPGFVADHEAEIEFARQDAVDQSIPESVEFHPDSELIPGWLENIDKTDAVSSDTPFMIRNEEELEMEPDADQIAPAELPSWVQEMRPFESMVSDVDLSGKHLEQIVETAGPLAGLQGVLPASPGFGKLRKPLNYSIKLRVTDDQSLQADQLEQMLGVETQAKSITRVDKKLPQRILRWVVTAIVFLVVALPILSGKQNTSAPTIYPPELVAAREILIGLPPASPVLLVFDYEPGYSGELEVAAAPIMENLLFSGARLAILSTSPTGPALAEQFLNNYQNQHNNQSSLQYANLGYLAGGASGVLSFVLNPSQTIPQALDGNLPWQTPLLQDVQVLEDFKAIIVLTDNSDTARIWVEQTGMALGETPLLMAISAQAEPMIRPYYDSKQVKGLVTGLAGGKAYEQLLQLSGLGQQYWDSFSYGLFIAELIIIIGALWSIMTIWRNRKSVIEEEA